MATALFSGDGAYFARLSGGTVLVWSKDTEGWTKGRCKLPKNADQIGFEALPEELREEVLAVLARADTVQGPIAGTNN